MEAKTHALKNLSVGPQRGDCRGLRRPHPGGCRLNLAYGPVQFRFSEALTVLPFLFPAAAPGLALGCLLTNILSPYGPIDMIVGTLATAIAAFLSIKMPRWYLAALPPIVVNALLLPPMWAWAEAGAVNGAFWAAYGLNLWTFVAEEAVVEFEKGTLLMLMTRD